ncbi:MAG: hypothetical protein U0324_03510 [Polyangiales bacterium]
MTSTQPPAQVVWPAGQPTTQAPALHTWPVAQRRLQPPQWAPLDRVSVSQPSAGFMLQSPWLGSQESSHTPLVQAARPPAARQARPQPPQWAAEVRVSASQPLDGSMSQSAKPASQAYEQAPAAHEAAAWARVAQAMPQPPQWAVVVRVSVSQPLASLPSQLPKPAAQVPTRQTPSRQAVAPPSVGHTRLHEPQWSAPVWVLASQPLAGSPSQSS